MSRVNPASLLCRLFFSTRASFGRMGLLVYDILRRFWYDERQGSLFLAQKIKFELVGVVI